MSTSSPPSNTSFCTQTDSDKSPRLPNGVIPTPSGSSRLPKGVTPTSNAESSPRLPSRAFAPNSTDETLTPDRQYSSVDPYDGEAAIGSSPPRPPRRGERTNVSVGRSGEPDWDGDTPDTPTPSGSGGDPDHISALGYGTEGHHKNVTGVEYTGTENQSSEQRESGETGQSET